MEGDRGLAVRFAIRPRSALVAKRASQSIANRRVEPDTFAAGMPAPARGRPALPGNRGADGDQHLENSRCGASRNCQAGPRSGFRGAGMSQETKAVSFAADGHPDEDQLLLALEHELPADDAARVEKHLGNCWSCRARFDEMQRGILAFVEYREQRYLPYLPAPPPASSGFRDRLRNLLREGSPIGLPTRVWRKLVALLVLPKQLKWVSAVATVMAIVIFWVHVLVNPGTVSANELLNRAIAAQNPPAATAKSTLHRVARQKMQIR